MNIHKNQPYIVNFRCGEDTKKALKLLKDEGFNMSAIIRKHIKSQADKIRMDAEDNG